MLQILILNAQRCIDTNAYPHIALLQIRLAPLGQGLPSHVTPLLNHPIRGIMLILIRPSANTDNNDEYDNTLLQRQVKADKNYDALRNYKTTPIGSTVVVQRED